MKQKLEFLDYLKLHPIPEKDEDMTDVDYAMKDVIDTLANEIVHNLDFMYTTIMKYSVYQEEIETERELVNCIKEIKMYNKFTREIILSWFYEESPALKYYSLESLDDDGFKTFEEFESMQKYKRCIISNIDIYNILKQDARTTLAKDYFKIEKKN